MVMLRNKKFSQAHRGKKRPQIAEALKRYYMNNEEARRKLTELRKGQKVSEETKKKISETLRSKHGRAKDDK